MISRSLLIFTAMLSCCASHLAHAGSSGHRLARTGCTAAAAPTFYVGARTAVCQALVFAAALNVFRTQPHLVLGMSQQFSTAAGTDSTATDSAASSGSPSSLPKSSPEKRTLYVQVSGQPGLAEIETSSDATVARLTKQIINELPSLAKVDPSAVSLHLATVVDKETDEVKGISEKPLPPRKSLVDANVGNGACIVVKMAGAVHVAAASPASLSKSYEAGVKLLRALMVAEPQMPDQATASVDFKEHGAMVLHPTGDAKMPQLGENAPIFIRYFYMDCITGVMSDLDPSNTAMCRRFIVLGNPGIGKSAFGLLLLRHALRQRPARNVIYWSDKSEDAWLFRANASGDGHDVVPFDKLSLHLLQELKDPRTVLIADSFRPPTVEAFTIMITSPQRGRYKDFQNSKPCRLLEFPPFSWPEIQAMRDTCYPDMKVEDVEATYAFQGGIPRYVFTFSRSELDDEVEGALTNVKLSEMVHLLKGRIIESQEKQSHRLLHMLPMGVAPTTDGPRPSPSTFDFYRPAALVFASKEVAARVYETLEAENAHRLHTMLAEGPSSDTMAAFYGKLYEPAALSVLSRGCVLECRDMQTGKESELKVPRSKETFFSTTSELGQLFKQKPMHLLVPRSKTFTAIDAVLPGGLLANVTINLVHDLKMRAAGKRSSEGIIPVHAALNPTARPDSDIYMYWILPRDRYKALARHRPGDTSSFKLVIPDEQQALGMEKKLEDAVKLASEAAAAGTADASKELDKAKAALKKFELEIAPKRAGWDALKRRVKHVAVCLQFSVRPSQRQRRKNKSVAQPGS